MGSGAEERPALREAGLIEGDRRGTWIYYRAIPAALAAASDALAPTRVPA